MTGAKRRALAGAMLLLGCLASCDVKDVPQTASTSDAGLLCNSHDAWNGAYDLGCVNEHCCASYVSGETPSAEFWACADSHGCAKAPTNCASGSGDCDGNQANGCESNINSDPKNCGRCGHNCGPSSSCSSGRCDPITLWTGNGGDVVSSLALDATRVYWTNTSAGTVVSLNKDGSDKVEVASGQVSPKAIAVDDTNVYWTTAPGTVMRCPKTGGAPGVVASSQTGLTMPQALGVDQTSVYWLTEQAVRKGPKAGGSPTDLATSEIGLTALALDAGHVYWVSFNAGDGTLKSVAKNGGAVTTLATGLNRPMGIALSTTHVFLAESGTEPNAFNDGSISRVPIEGGSKDVLKQGQGAPYSIAADGYLFWTNFGGQTVVAIAIPPAGQPAETPILLAGAQSGAGGLAVDATMVFWLSKNTVLKVTRP
jgi:hypothetical protein